MAISLKGFKPLKGFESKYLISSDGQVYNSSRETLLTTFKNKIGKHYVTLIIKGKRRGKSIEELIESTFGSVLQEPKWKLISKQRNQPIQESINQTSKLPTSKSKWKPI